MATEDDTKFSDSLRERGFEAGESVHEESCSFTKDDAMASLFNSTYSEPIPVDLDVHASDATLRIVLTRAEPRYAPYNHRNTDSPAGCFDEPDWYFEGWVLKSGFDPFKEITRIRMVVLDNFGSEILWQVIPDDPTDGIVEMASV